VRSHPAVNNSSQVDCGLGVGCQEIVAEAEVHPVNLSGWLLNIEQSTTSSDNRQSTDMVYVLEKAILSIVLQHILDE
jgi:hypothetical protein